MKRKTYMKKIVTVITVATMLMSSLSACGKTEDTATEKTVSETVAETTSESETAETESVAETEAIASTEENTEDDRLAEGMEKVNTLIDAYKNLMSQHKYAEDLLQADVETLDYAELFDLGFKFADGNEIQDSWGYYAVIVKYYYDYVNSGIKYGDGYSDFSELASQIPSCDEIMNKYGFITDNGESDDTNDVIMFEGIRVLSFIASCESVQGTDLVETTDYVMGEYTSAYAIPLDCDGNTDLTAVFDADGNLMNIRSGDDFPYVYSFPDGDTSSSN